ncbi:MAG: hypothetical protein EHM64_12410 [Ignavibacteriae bacterium]|nr:MAG: hypothetical protein EHM64_12410 [Ignavibacteriota bacterium]
MISEARNEENKKVMRSSKLMLLMQIAGLQICMIALLFSNEGILFAILLFVGATVFTQGFEKTKWHYRLRN